jgi:hypothetical protein
METEIDNDTGLYKNLRNRLSLCTIHRFVVLSMLQGSSMLNRCKWKMLSALVWSATHSLLLRNTLQGYILRGRSGISQDLQLLGRGQFPLTECQTTIDITCHLCREDVFFSTWVRREFRGE